MRPNVILKLLFFCLVEFDWMATKKSFFDDDEVEDEGNYIYYYDDDVRKDFVFFNEQTSQPNITMIPGFCRVRPIWRGGDWSWPLRGQVQ